MAILCFAGVSIADDKQRAVLDSALAKYDSTVAEARDAILGFLDKRLEAARKRGDASLVSSINDDKQRFETTGKVPDGVPRKTISKLVNDRQKLIEAYRTAIGNYTKSKQDDLAKSLQEEMETFSASGDFGAQGNGVTLFNGKDLTGWRGLPAQWRVEGGMIVGTNKPGELHSDTFLLSEKTFADFELRCKVKVGANSGCNSGIQIRSVLVDKNTFQVNGPQVEFGEGGAAWGSLYGQGIGMIQSVDPAIVAPVLRANDFNDVFVRCKGANITIKVNGVTTVDNNFPNLSLNGVIGFQLHKDRTGSIFIKDVLLTDLSKNPK